MPAVTNTSDISAAVRKHFIERGVAPTSVSPRAFPDEVVVIVEVQKEELETAIAFASQIEAFLPPNHLVVVRQAEKTVEDEATSIKSIADPRVSRLIELLNERSRTSEQLPSLHYIKDAGENLRIAVSKRHHIVFGRRGVGKTALLLEAKRQVASAGGLTLWINVQTLRGLSATAAFLTVVRRIAEIPGTIYQGRNVLPASIGAAQTIIKWTQELLSRADLTAAIAAPIVPEVQRLISMLCAENACDLFIFIDDLHYLAMKEQPLFLDQIHGVTRDASAWIKIAGIRNQCRVFESDPPVGMQVGHDAAMIPLDVTLEDPRKARIFLTEVLQTYLAAAGIGNRSGVLSGSALDRLILASAGVPRDFLVLCARAIQIARTRDNARLVGIQDVNEAAGEAGKQKLADLEEDAASSMGMANARLEAMEQVRQFSIVQNHSSFFRIDYRDKAARPEEYALVQSLMDLRMVHLVKTSLSEAHAAGEKSEVYLIDLSEYSSYRFKKDINVLELQADDLVLRKTGEKGVLVVGDTPRKLIQIFRTGPLLDLSQFTPLVASIGR